MSWLRVPVALVALGRGNTIVPTPVVLVHPSLEMAALDRQPTGGWAVSTLRLYTTVGLEPVGEAGVDRELSDSHAALDGGDLTVTVPMFSWGVDARGSDSSPRVHLNPRI